MKKASQLPSYKLRLLRQQLARRKANLLDPNWGEAEARKRFPIWYPGMSTQAYIDRFQEANTGTLHFPGAAVVGRLTFTHRPGMAPWPLPEETLL